MPYESTVTKRLLAQQCSVYTDYQHTRCIVFTEPARKCNVNTCYVFCRCPLRTLFWWPGVAVGLWWLIPKTRSDCLEIYIKNSILLTKVGILSKSSVIMSVDGNNFTEVLSLFFHSATTFRLIDGSVQRKQRMVWKWSSWPTRTSCALLRTVFALVCLCYWRKSARPWTLP